LCLVACLARVRDVPPTLSRPRFCPIAEPRSGWIGNCLRNSLHCFVTIVVGTGGAAVPIAPIIAASTTNFFTAPLVPSAVATWATAIATGTVICAARRNQAVNPLFVGGRRASTRIVSLCRNSFGVLARKSLRRSNGCSLVVFTYSSDFQIHLKGQDARLVVHRSRG